MNEWVNVMKLLSSIKGPLEDSGHEIRVRPVVILCVFLRRVKLPRCKFRGGKAENLIKIEWRLCQMDMMNQDKCKGIMGVYKREMLMIGCGI